MMRVLDLFSGIGGFSLGLHRTGGFETVAFCEIEDYPRRVLEKNFPGVPIHRDVRELRAEDVGAIDVICGGFPCQDISLANSGAMRGLQGPKSGLWREFERQISAHRPAFVIIENSPVLRSQGLGQILNELYALGYDAEWHCIPATAVDASHSRDRVWIVAYPVGYGNRIPKGQVFSRRDLIKYVSPWATEPHVRRVADGLPDQSHRLKCLGNAVVPQIPEMIGRAILEAEASR